jgi:VanZ family protein
VTTASPLWRVAAVAWAVVIFVSGVIPTQSTVHAISGGHDSLATTIGHFMAYVALGFLLGVAFSGWRVDTGRLMLGLALAAALGGAIELVQGPLSYRDAQVVDFVVDVAGAGVGLVLFSAVTSVTRPRSRPG